MLPAEHLRQSLCVPERPRGFLVGSWGEESVGQVDIPQAADPGEAPFVRQPLLGSSPGACVPPLPSPPTAPRSFVRSLVLKRVHTGRGVSVHGEGCVCVYVGGWVGGCTRIRVSVCTCGCARAPVWVRNTHVYNFPSPALFPGAASGMPLWMEIPPSPSRSPQLSALTAPRVPLCLLAPWPPWEPRVLWACVCFRD